MHSQVLKDKQPRTKECFAKRIYYLSNNLEKLRNLQQYFSYIMVVSFVAGENRSTRRKPPTCRKSLSNIITVVSNILETYIS